MNTKRPQTDKARELFKAHGGTLRTMEAIHRGIHPRTLYAMRDRGQLIQVHRGVYRLAEMKTPTDEDLVTVASTVRQGVICLISALAYHEITTEIPPAVHVAISRTTAYPKVDYPPTRFFRFSDAAYTAGIEIHTISGVNVSIYSAEKTLADCFKYRNKLGLDTVLEALQLYRQRKSVNRPKLLEYARICRVYRIMKPYLEASL